LNISATRKKQKPHSSHTQKKKRGRHETSPNENKTGWTLEKKKVQREEIKAVINGLGAGRPQW